MGTGLKPLPYFVYILLFNDIKENMYILGG